MKKNILIGLFLLSFVAQRGYAQWTSDDTKNTPVSTGLLSSSDQPQIATSKFGTTFITWVQYDPTALNKYSLYAQAMDKNGNRLWGDFGRKVDSLQGLTRFIYNITADSTGNLIVGTQNTRFDPYNQFPVVYKLDRTNGAIIWKKELKVDGTRYEIAPFFAITPSNNVLVSWTGVKITTVGAGEVSWGYVQKLDPATGNFMWTKELAIADSSNNTTNGVPQVTMSTSENFYVTWQQKGNYAGNGQVLNKLMVQRYDANKNASFAQPIAISSVGLALGYFAKPMMDGSGALVVAFTTSGALGAELYGQVVATTGTLRWGTDGLLLARNNTGSAVESGIHFDKVDKKLWFAIRQDMPGASVRANRIYLQGVDNSQNFLFGGAAIDGAEIIAKTNGTTETSIVGIGMRDAKDGFIIVYEQGDVPAPATIKATKVNYQGVKVWTEGDSTITVSTAPGVASVRMGDYVVADSQLVVAMNTRQAISTEIAQNIKTGGTIGVGTVKQVVSFNTDTLYVTYGDPDLDLGASSNSGQPPHYSIDDPTKASLTADNKIHLLDAGIFRVTVRFLGTAVYMPKTSGVKVIIVRKRMLNVIAENKTKEYGRGNPTLTMRFESFINGDDVLSFQKLPTITTTATTSAPIGVYPIRLQGGTSSKYELKLVNAQMTVYPTSGMDKDNIQAYCSSPSMLEVRIYTNTDQSGYVQLIDMGGKLLANVKVNLVKGFNHYQIPVSQVATAVYVVRFAGTVSTLDEKIKIK